MAISVRQADLSSDREELIRFCRTNLPIHPDAQRFNWLYLNNPSGRASTWIASDEKTGEMIGIASAFPRRFWIGGTEQRAWILGDFCISERFRSLGPALTLQRKCMGSIPAEEVWYDFPSPVMLAVYQRLGVPLFSTQIRHVRPLKLDRTLGRTGSYLVRAIGSLRAWPPQRLFGRSGRTECTLHEGVFGTEFTDLDKDPGTHRFARGSRSAHYLNWRYRQNPTENYKVITARHEGTLKGYLVVHLGSREATLSDLLAVDMEVTVPSLLNHLIRVLLKTDADRLNASLLNESHLRPYFRSAGFIARETAPVVLQARDGMNAPDLFQSKSWLLLHGDRES